MAERIIALLAGPSGAGKSFFVANLPDALIYDTDIGGGLSYADARIKRNRSERIEVSSYPEILNDLKARHKDGRLKDRLFVAIDHLSTLQQESVLRHNPSQDRDFGSASNKGAGEWRKIREFCRAHDFNLICTAHLKANWEGGEVNGVTAEASKNIGGDMQQVLHLIPGKYPPNAQKVKWRRDPEDSRGQIPLTFPLTVEEFFRLAGASEILKPREPIKTATPEQVAELERLLDVVKITEEEVAKWHKKAGVDTFAEYPETLINTCIAFAKKKVSDATTTNGKVKV